MPNNIHYNSMQQSQQQSQPTLYNYQQQQQHHRHHHRHHHHHASPTPQVHTVSSYSNHRLNNSNNSNNIHNHQTPLTTPLLSITQSSAYFLDRVDLENYTTQILKQTVENILSKTKSKGLKVKISLPDDGLIIDNITDPNQSWIFKTSELLYFWRDPYYLNIIIVVTINRSRHHSSRPYSASIFRLRGTDSAQLFLHQAQQFFANLSTVANTPNPSKSHRNKSVEKLTRTENQIIDPYSSSNKPKLLSIINEQSSSNLQQSPQTTTTPIHRVTRAEFDPGKTTTMTKSMDNNSNHRTFSETASSTDSHSTNSTKEVLSYTKKLNDDDDDKMTTISNNLSGDQVVELMRELKELRNEIASLKLAQKFTPVTRSMSTSPLANNVEYSKQINNSSTPSPSFPDITSQSEVDAETQTDFSLIQTRRRQISRKNKKTMIGSGGVSTLIKKKPSQTSARNGRRTFSSSSTNTLSDQEGTSPESSSHVNDSSNDTNPPVLILEQYQPVILTAPPRPILMRNQNSFIPLTNSTLYGNQMGSNFNSTEEGSLLSGIPVSIEKEIPKFLSTNNPSSNSEFIGPSVPIISAGSTSFRSSLENSKIPTEHIYENVPILIQPNSNREAYYNIPIINADDQQQENQSNDHVYYTINNNRESDSEQQYIISGPTISNSPPTTDENSFEIQSSVTNLQQKKPQIISTGRHRNQPIYFANHLTNPIFNVDKQLLINTIANQFGVDLNSPQLQQLITNQHLFVARKRTFANMVWQLTPDEETALCSSPLGTQTNNIDIDSNHSTGRSILKAAKHFNSTTKRRGISWDSALE